MSRIAVIGSGYVGTVVAACLAEVGHAVVGVETDPAKLGALAAGRVPFREADLEPLVAAGVEAGTLRFTDDYGLAMDESDVVFICVGTPEGDDGMPDMRYVEAAAKSMGRHMRHRHVLVNKSTVPIGTGRWLTSILEDHIPAELFCVVSNPEFLREGSAVRDFLYPDRVVIGGADADALDAVAEVYAPILAGRPGHHRPGPVPLVRTTLTTAEMTKYASNSFLAAKISFINELARLCDLVGADVREVAAGMGLDPRIGPDFLQAGIGWGGSCFPKDTAALIATAGEYGFDAPLLRAVVQANGDQRQLVVDELLHHLKALRGMRIGLWGLAFKPGTDDRRDSPAVDVAARLLKRGAIVTAWDPAVGAVPELPELRHAGDPCEAARGADAVVVATDWPQLRDVDLAEVGAVMRGTLLFDGRNMFDAATVASAGLEYRGVGRPASVPLAGLVGTRAG